jgi:hypothetical protein
MIRENRLQTLTVWAYTRIPYQSKETITPNSRPVSKIIVELTVKTSLTAVALVKSDMIQLDTLIFRDILSSGDKKGEFILTYIFINRTYTATICHFLT